MRASSRYNASWLIRNCRPETTFPDDGPPIVLKQSWTCTYIWYIVQAVYPYGVRAMARTTPEKPPGKGISSEAGKGMVTGKLSKPDTRSESGRILGEAASTTRKK